MPRKKRILEELPIAAPLPPREPSAAELEAQAQNDARIREYLKFRLGPVIAELRKRNKKFCKPIGDGEEIQIISPTHPEHPKDGPAEAEARQGNLANGEAGSTEKSEIQMEQQENDDAVVPVQENAMPANGASPGQPDQTQPMLATTSVEVGPDSQMQEQAQLAVPMAMEANEVFLTFRFHDISLDKVHERLFADRYHTPEMMLADIQRIVENAYHEGDPDTLNKADQMLNYARIMCDQACDPAFRGECQRMAQRERDRAKKRALDRQKAREEAAAEAAKREQAAAAAQPDNADSTSNKRQRDDGEDQSGTEQTKRARFSEDFTMADSPTRAGPTTQSLVPATPVAPVTLPTSTESAESNMDVTAPAPVAAPSVPAREPTPPPPAEPLPEFVLPQATLQDLGRFLVSHTGELAVDELEQLRAACYDCIWRARKDWDKTAVIAEIMELSEEFITELENSKRHDQD